MPPTITEFDLIKQLQQKNQRAYRHLYDAYAPALYSVVKKRLGCDLSSEEVLQNVFVKVWVNIQTYSSEKGSLYTWMQRIARNEAIDYTRTKHSRLLKLTNSLGNDEYEATQYRTRTDRLDILRSLSLLPHRNRAVIELSQIGYSCREIGELLQIPEGTIKTVMRSTYRMLRIKLS